MRVDRVRDLSIFVLEKGDAKGEGEEEEVEYRSWVSMGDFFHLLLAETTPTITWRELTGGERKEGGGGATTTTTMGDRDPATSKNKTTTKYLTIFFCCCCCFAYKFTW
jgi:hypothetical protein